MATSGARPRHLTFDQFRDGCASYLGRKPQCRMQRGRGRDVKQEGQEPQDLGPELYAVGWQWEQHSMLPQLSHLKRVVEIVPSERSSRASKIYEKAKDEEEDPILSSGLSDQGELQDHTSTTYPPPASATAINSSSSTITCTHEIFYSSTWSTPVLYLQAHNTQTGQSLSLEEMMDPRLGVFLPGEDGRGSSLQGTGRRSALHALLPQAVSLRRGGDDGARDTAALAVPLVEDDASTASKDEAVTPAYFPPLSLSDHPITSLPCISLHPCQTAVVIGEMMQSHGVSAEQEGDHHGEEVESVYGREYLEAFMTICASAVEMRG